MAINNTTIDTDPQWVHNNSSDGDNGYDTPNNDLPQPINDQDGGVAPWNLNFEQSAPNLYLFNSPTHPSATVGTTSVDTASLNSFITYIGTLIPQVETVRDELNHVNVQPGAFADADDMRTKINGTGGLAGQYYSILTDVVNGLTSMKTGLTTLSATYADTEDLNNLSASDLQNDFYLAGQYFGNIITDGGGSSTPTLNGTGNPNTSTGNPNTSTGNPNTATGNQDG